MKITVETGQWAARYVSERVVTIDMPGACTVEDVVASLNIPDDEAGMAILGGKAVPSGHSLNNGDSITLHPIIIGG